MCGTAYSFDRYGQFENACLRWDCMQVLFLFLFFTVDMQCCLVMLSFGREYLWV